MDKKSYQILVVEDNHGDFTLVQDFLFEQISTPFLWHANNYEEAVEILSGGEVEIDIVLLDLSLPDKTGEELIRETVGLCGHIPIIVLTGYSDFSFGVKSLSLGISDYLLKDELSSISLYKSMLYSLERKKQQLAMENSHRKYSDLFNLSPLPMWVLNFDTLAFLDVNVAALDHYGYNRDEFLSMTLKDLKPADQLPSMEETLVNDYGIRNQTRTRAVVHQLKDGTLRNLELKIAPIPHEEENINIVIATDVTDRLFYIKAIEEQNEQLKKISWMQSHTIRSPLSRIMGLVPLILSADNKDKDTELLLDYLKSSAEQLDGVIKEISNNSKVG